MTKVLMVQGTMSNVGKSLLVAGLCRIFHQDGLRVAPFKSQNMALNSYVTRDGLEMGRAQVLQAEAAGIEPSVWMNPILLKPTDNEGSQVVVNGKPIGNMKAREYFAYKTSLLPVIREAFQNLMKEQDIVLLEGAGSPAEINLKEQDIVNMGMAELVDAPVLLVGDIDRGGVFAQLWGTWALLEEQERARVRGLVINKFRGDASLLIPGISMLEERCGVPVLGTIPYMPLQLEEEDSLTERFASKQKAKIDLAVLRFPRMSNASDFDIFLQTDEVSVRYVQRVEELGKPDLLILPGTKNTGADWDWVCAQGWKEEILRQHQNGMPILGICGGYQLLGQEVADPDQVEGGHTVQSLGLLPLHTVLQKEKRTEQRELQLGKVEGIFSALQEKKVQGYEIHMGQTTGQRKDQIGLISLGGKKGAGDIYGTYLHGFFDRAEIAETVLQALAKKKGEHLTAHVLLDHREQREQELDRLADLLRSHLQMEAVYALLQEVHLT